MNKILGLIINKYKRQPPRRLNLLLGFCILLASILFVQLFRLQILQFDVFLAISNENRLSVIKLKPNRGKILDRNGNILATNQPIYQLNIRSTVYSGIAYEKIGELAKILNFNASLTRLNFFHRRNKISKIIDIPFAELDKEGLVKFTKVRSLYPEVSVTSDNKRFYPYKQHAAHILGYVNAISDEDLNNKDLFDSIEQAEKFSHVGKSGIERFYDRLLRGENGHTSVEVNAEGNIVRTISTYEQKDGTDIYLNIDIELQQFIDNFMDGKKGAIVVMDSQNGNIYAATSAPFFDNNLLTNNTAQPPVSLSDDLDNILLNRVSQKLYSPADVFKPFIGLAALEILKLNPRKSFISAKYFALKTGQRLYEREEIPAKLNLNQALTFSSDIYFYNLAQQMGIQKMHYYLENFSFGKQTNIDLLKESAGTLPNGAWKMKRFGQTWLPHDNLLFSIGKGFNSVTPLQLTVTFSSLANKGHNVRPRLAKIHPFLSKKLTAFNADYWGNISQAMHIPLQPNYNHIDKQTSTAFVGKTSKANPKNFSRLNSNNDSRFNAKLTANRTYQSIFVGYAPLKNPQVTLTIILEDSQSDDQRLLSIANKIFNKFFSLD